MIAFLIIGIIIFVHTVTWLVTKGAIWVMFELADINWYGKFWAVYVALIVLSYIFKGIDINKK